MNFNWIVAVVLMTLTVVSILGTSPVGAIVPPVTGTVTCSLSGTSTFSPPLGYDPGLTGNPVGPRARSRWTMLGTLTACSGTQSGGRPSGSLPIDNGTIRLIGRAMDHSCRSVETSGLELRNLRIVWFAADDTRVGTTVTDRGSIAVSNVGLPFPLFPPDPPPGPPSFATTVSGRATARVFPGETLTLSALGDPLSYPALPCSTTFSGPPLPQGIGGVSFSGVSGPSTVAITP